FLEELKAKHVTASDLSSTAHQVHVQRPARDLRRVIDLVAKYVAQMGEQFEEALRHSLRDQRREVKDELVFLKADPDSAEAQYYRWRVFSFAQGDTRQKWRSEPFQMCT
ncbi:RRC1, partial [Symbiodinium sp. CCMP2456]